MSEAKVVINKAVWREIFTSPEVVKALVDEAGKVAKAASAELGPSPRGHEYRNPNFGVAYRIGKNSAVAVVVAANPRSIWKSRNKGALDGYIETKG